MNTPQTGIFSLGDAAHIYLEFEALAGCGPRELISAIADIHEPRTTVGGVNLVAGFRPELWREAAPADAPPGLIGYNAELRGPDGYVMPATQADAWLWIAGASYDVCFDVARAAIATLKPLARLASELQGWSYLHSRDLTGFEDGTENPSLLDAVDVALIPDGQPGTGGSVLLYQKWKHASEFTELPVEAQERVIGRSKVGSIEFAADVMPPDAHVPRTVIKENGAELKIFRRNVPYGNVTDHGTVFVGFSCDQRRLDRMLRRMAGMEDGIRDALTRYTTALSGAYYFVPSAQALARFGTPKDDD
jgi:putative iron-dependent peroxidase